MGYDKAVRQARRAAQRANEKGVLAFRLTKRAKSALLGKPGFLEEMREKAGLGRSGRAEDETNR